MLDDLLRPLKDRAFAPVARGLGGRVHPNAVSGAALLAGLAAAYWCAVGNLRAGLIWWTLNRLLDGLDGVVARVNGSPSDFGGYLDIVFDFVGYAAIPLGLALGAGTLAIDRAALFLLASFW